MDALTISTDGINASESMLLSMILSFASDQLSREWTVTEGDTGVAAVLYDITNPRARLAWEMFADRVRAAIGALAVQMNGLDALIFTDRIGEGSPALRAAVCDGLQCLGVSLDPAKNQSNEADRDVAARGSAVRVLVIRTREELMIAREVRRIADAKKSGRHD